MAFGTSSQRELDVPESKARGMAFDWTHTPMQSCLYASTYSLQNSSARSALNGCKSGHPPPNCFENVAISFNCIYT